MHIVHVMLTRRFAGTERYVIDLTAAQAQNHKVTLVLRQRAAKNRPEAIAHRVDSAVNLRLAHDLAPVWHATRIVRQLKPDILHVHLNRACKVANRLKGLCPRLATLHIEYKAHQHGNLDGLIAIAPWQLPAIPEQLKSRTVQIDNWTIPRTASADARQRLRAEHGIAADTVLIGALGRLEETKGFDVLIEAFKRAAIPNSKLVIAGRGRAEDSLRRLADQNVLLTGFSPKPEDWLAAFDVFVSAARYEPFGLVMLEAMAAQLPIIATASQGAQHLAGLIDRSLIPVDDIDAMASALRTIVAQGYGRRSYPLEPFTIEKKMAQVEVFYEKLLHNK